MNRFEAFKTGSAPYWQRYTEHEFVTRLSSGSLQLDQFQHYLKQDYLFILQFARAWAVAIYKSNSIEDMRSALSGLKGLLDGELSLHINYCNEWGIDKGELARLPESPACIAYTRYVLDRGMAGDLAELHCALAPCIIGYAEIGQQLKERQKDKNNPYMSWIEQYASTAYARVAEEEISVLERLCRDISPKRMEELQVVFTTATRMEIAFWQMGLDLT